MMPTAHIHGALGEGRRGHQHFTHVVGCHELELGACLDYENLAVFVGQEYHVVRRYRRSPETTAAVLDAAAKAQQHKSSGQAETNDNGAPESDDSLILHSPT